MKCPVDGEMLAIAERNGVEIDYCPKCRGVWLDRGELDKILQRAGSSEPPDRRDEPTRYEGKHGKEYDGRGHHPKKKESFWSDLFDF